MFAAIGYALPIAVGLLAASMPVVGITLMLVTGGDRRVVGAFLLGWCAGIFTVAAITIAVVDVALPESETGPAPWESVLRIGLGVALMLLAARNWRGRPRGVDEREAPKWMSAFDAITPAKALGLAFVGGAFNPKNTVLIVAGASAIATATEVVAEQVVALVVFVVVASLGVAGPIVLGIALGDRATAVFEGARNWMIRHNAVVMTAVLLAFAVVLLAAGIGGLRAG
ncbi:GAP family protein [Rhodococcus kronopolitis]|uniref:GAP family protein n=1 Tax=Rhodococcus kronopolitis TaxID=1460226 RepID=A0ABV9FNT2_9NOCA